LIPDSPTCAPSSSESYRLGEGVHLFARNKPAVCGVHQSGRMRRPRASEVGVATIVALLVGGGALLAAWSQYRPILDGTSLPAFLRGARAHWPGPVPIIMSADLRVSVVWTSLATAVVAFFVVLLAQTSERPTGAGGLGALGCIGATIYGAFLLAALQVAMLPGPH
jgi:hypothetical protein